MPNIQKISKKGQFVRASGGAGCRDSRRVGKRDDHKTICKRKSVFALIAAAALASPINAHSASSGIGGGSLASRIDSKIEAVMVENNIPGMTVAVIVDGRLVYSKGLGSARAVGNKIQMIPDMRTRIGSVSKATMTAGSAFKLMNEKNINPKTKRLYGPAGVFGDKYKNDIKFGAKRFSPIAGMAIDISNKTYTWYSNQTFSIGKTFDLDRHQAPKAFKLPAGRRVTDIRDMAIADSGRVYTWYNDGTRSIGTPSDLGSHQQVALDDEGKPRKVKFPGGKSMLFVVGIGIAKTGADTDHVYVWYEDGTLSSGGTLDFTEHFSSKAYKVKSGSPYRIRSMAIAANDHIFTWLSNGKAQSGMSHDLAKYRQPYAYTLPPQGRVGGPGDRQKWVHDITLQHLMDHEAGFQKNAGSGAKAMFGKTDETITPELYHRYMLRARPLRWPPGEADSYSNHGFGLWNIIFEALSGKTYRNYAINNFLKPIGMADAIRPLTIEMDEYDAFPHQITNGEYAIAPAKNSTTGLAAGGWTASASSLLKITKHLVQTYSTEALKNMGWSSNAKGRLSHNGRTKGGTAYVVMYPDGYIGGGQDVSGVHVALAANIWTSTGALGSLGRSIAVEVPQSGIGSHFDLWQGIQ